MYTSVIVPLDTSTQAERALPLAESVARRCNAPIRLLTFIPSGFDDENQRTYIDTIANGMDVPVSVDVRDKPGWRIDDLVAAVEEEAGALVCMASFGRGRTGALLGSIAEGLLRHGPSPALLVGPRCNHFDIIDGDPMVVAIDASPAADDVTTLAGSWATTFGLVPWLVTSIDQSAIPDAHDGEEPILEPSEVHRLADRLSDDAGRDAERDILHGRHSAQRLVSFADDVNASLICMGTRGATGLARLAVGSVCAATVHRAPCPVLVHPTTR